MKYSLIVPAYNVENFIANTLDSIFGQTYKDYEVIVVNDGSTDNTLMIVEQYKEQYSREINIITQENGGLGAARNTGMLASKGEFLFFIDSDDTIEKDALEKINTVIERENSDIVMFNNRLVDMEGNTIEIEKVWDLDSNITLQSHKSLLLCNPSACNKVIRKSLFIENDIKFPGKVWYEDLQTITKLYPWAKKISYLDEPLYIYLQRPGSIMNTKRVDRTVEVINAIEVVRNYYKSIRQFECYKEEIEFLTVFHVFIGMPVRVVKIDRKSKYLNDFYEYTEKYYPNFEENQYVKQLPKSEKLKIKLLKRKWYLCLYFILKIKNSLG